jgi:ElaB/YqjD/DUF883 family membrane-anchored ribosome-binding protein
LEKVNMERSAELVFIRRNMQKLVDARDAFEANANKSEQELQELRFKTKRELKILKEHTRKISSENQELSEAMSQMKTFFDNIADN